MSWVSTAVMSLYSLLLAAILLVSAVWVNTQSDLTPSNYSVDAVHAPASVGKGTSLGTDFFFQTWVWVFGRPPWAPL